MVTGTTGRLYIFDRPLRKDPFLWLLALSPVLGFQTAWAFRRRLNTSPGDYRHHFGDAIAG